MTPEDVKLLRNLLAYPLLTPAEKLVWIAIDLCPIQIENGDYCKVSRADKGRLMMMTSLSMSTIERSLEHFDINYFSEHYVRQATLIVEKVNET